MSYIGCRPRSYQTPSPYTAPARSSYSPGEAAEYYQARPTYTDIPVRPAMPQKASYASPNVSPALQRTSYVQAVPQRTSYARLPVKPKLQQTVVSCIPVPTTPPQINADAARDDARHKRHIRMLKALSRVIALLLAIATFVPLAMALAFMAVTDAEDEPDVTWPTYLYSAIAAISLVLNTMVLISYCRGGHKVAQESAKNERLWTGVLRLGEALMWIVGVSVYKYEAEAEKANDLWSWSCSAAAKELESADAAMYCTGQTASFWTGALNVVALMLTGCIYAYALYRRRSKAKAVELGKTTMDAMSAMEPLRD